MLHKADLSQTLERGVYRKKLPRLQARLRHLAFELYRRKRSLVLVFEGWDAAGKGGTIRRLTAKLDPRGYRVYPIAAPKGEDAEHHYLWRFWRRLTPPSNKQVLIFDRSWYGRVLVERVERFAREEEWRRAYREINDFEGQLVDHGILLGKLWFHISKEEQLRRFQQRLATPHKSWKLTDEDWRNRERWDAYESAVQEMLLKTSTLEAPWTVVEADDKYFARIQALERVEALLEDGLRPDRDAEEGRKDRG
jgi:polyphosphate kinase 2 (PPK2 family)